MPRLTRRKVIPFLDIQPAIERSILSKLLSIFFKHFLRRVFRLCLRFSAFQSDHPDHRL
jgi:hypothetical protein